MQRIREITNLMKLDFICIAKKSLIPLLFGVLAFSLFGLYISPVFAVPIILFAGLSVHTMFAIASKNDFNKLYGVLPVHRSSIVFAHFILGIIAIGVVTALTVAVGAVSEDLALFGEIDESAAAEYYAIKSYGFTVPITSTLLFVATCIFTAMEYSAIFILGVEKEVLGTILVVVVIGVGSCAVTMSGVDFIGEISEFLGNIYADNEVIFYAALYSSGIIAMLIFAFITSVIIRKREL